MSSVGFKLTLAQSFLMNASLLIAITFGFLSIFLSGLVSVVVSVTSVYIYISITVAGLIGLCFSEITSRLMLWSLSVSVQKHSSLEAMGGVFKRVQSRGPVHVQHNLDVVTVVNSPPSPLLLKDSDHISVMPPTFPSVVRELIATSVEHDTIGVCIDKFETNNNLIDAPQSSFLSSNGQSQTGSLNTQTIPGTPEICDNDSEETIPREIPRQRVESNKTVLPESIHYSAKKRTHSKKYASMRALSGMVKSRLQSAFMRVREAVRFQKTLAAHQARMHLFILT